MFPILSSGGSSIKIFADSVAGNDSNSGLTAAVPVKTLAKVATLATSGTKIGLKTDSVWNETLEILTLTNISIVSYGSGAKPQILADDVLSSGGWTKTTLAINLYQRSYTPFASYTSGSDYLSVYENGIPLVAAASSIACDLAAGSCFIDDVSNIIYINATGGTKDPSTNGNVYAFTAREYAIHLDGAGSSVTGLYARRAARNDGAIVLNGKNVYINACESRDGNKHNLLIGSGSVVNTVVANCYFGSNNSNMIVGFLGDAATSALYIDGCTIGLDTYSGLVSGIYHHASSNSYASIAISNTTFNNMGTGYSGDNVNSQSLINNSFINCTTGAAIFQPIMVATGNHATIGGSTAAQYMFDVQNSGVLTFGANVFCNTGSGNQQMMFRCHNNNGLTLTSTGGNKCSFTTPSGFQTTMFHIETGVVTLTTLNEREDGGGAETTFLDASGATTLTYSGSGNKFAANTDFYVSGSSYTGVAAWQGAGFDLDAQTTGYTVAC